LHTVVVLRDVPGPELATVPNHFDRGDAASR